MDDLRVTVLPNVIAIPWLGVLVNWIIAIVGVGALWLLWRSGKAPVEKIAYSVLPWPNEWKGIWSVKLQ